MNEKSIVVISNFDKCLEMVKKLKNQVDHDQVNPAAVCADLVRLYIRDIEDFKQLPLLWNHLFVSQISQLLVLAKKCHHYPGHDPSILVLEHWPAYQTVVDQLRQHFLRPTLVMNSIDSAENIDLVETSETIETIDLKLHSPTISLTDFIATLSANAKCQAEQIPTALTAIMHDYCFIDPFNPDDAEFVKSKLLYFLLINKD